MLPEAFDTLDVVEGDTCVIELERDMVAECPNDDITDEYALTVRYLPKSGRCIELASFATLVEDFEDVEASQEEITRFLAHFIHTHVGPEWVEVELSGEHYGTDVTTEVRRQA